MYEAVHAALDKVTPDGKVRGELEREIGALHRVETHAAERRLALTAALDALDDGGVDAAGATRARTKMSARSARRAADTATQLARMPRTAGALAEGRISLEHAEAAAHAAERTSPEEVDAALAADAVALPADRFARRSREWAGARERLADQQARYDRQRSQREAKKWVGAEGMHWFLVGLDPISATTVEGIWREEIDRLWRDDGGRDGTPDQVRTPSQRGADAFVNLITGSRADGATRPHPRFVGVAKVDLDRLRADVPEGVAAIVDGEPLPQSVLERIACDSVWAGMIFDSDGSVLWKGRDVRTATADQWTALIARDGGCVCCGADPAHCEAHHLDPWAPPTRGSTDIDRMVLVCRRTHHLVHDHGWVIARIDGRWVLRAPGAGSEERRPAA